MIRLEIFSKSNENVHKKSWLKNLLYYKLFIFIILFENDYREFGRL